MLDGPALRICNLRLSSSLFNSFMHPYHSLGDKVHHFCGLQRNMIHSALLSSFIVQLCLAILAVAAPVGDEALATTDHGNAWQYGTGGGILGLIVLILDIIA